MLKILLSGALLLIAAAGVSGAQEDPDSVQTSLKCTLPVNVAQGIHYEDQTGEDLLPWGPSALTVTPEGHLLVADAARTRLVEYAEDCSLRRVLDLAGKVRGISDVKVTDEGYFVLDAAAPAPVVVQLDATARVVSRLPVPKSLAAELPSLVVEEGQRILLGLHEGAETVPLAEDGIPIPENALARGIQAQGVRLLAAVEDGKARGEHEGARRLALTIDAQKTFIESDRPVAVFRVLGAVAGRHIYARAVEVTERSGMLWVRESIYRVTWEGKVDGVVRGLFADQYVFVPNRLAVDPERDEVLALFTYPDRAEIHELVFASPGDLAPRSPEDPDPDAGPQELAVDYLDLRAAPNSRCKVFPGEIRAIADGYIANTAKLSEKNISGTCEKREKPRYLTTPQVYGSVPYDWGGFDSVASYNAYMAQGKQAGDISTVKGQDDVATCSRGVDCSGFVSRTWKLETKRGSSNIGEICAQVSKKELRFGDVLNKDFDHVVLIDQVRDTGVYVYEATKDGKLDRVVHRETPWSRYSKYKMLRYENYCEIGKGQIGCVGASSQLAVNVPVNLTGGPFTGAGSGSDYDGDPLYFKVIGNFNRSTRALEVTLDFYQDAGYSRHVRTDSCSGPLDQNDQFSDSACTLTHNTSAGCPIFLRMSLRGGAGVAPAPEPGSRQVGQTIRR